MGIDLLHESHRPSNNSLTLRSFIQGLVKLLLVRFDGSFNACLRSDTLPTGVLFRLDRVRQLSTLLSSFLDGADVVGDIPQLRNRLSGVFDQP